MKKNSQIWYIDFVLALTLFIITLLISLRYITNNYMISVKDTSPLLVEADKVSQSLLTAGIPDNWTAEYVTSIGIAPENILNLSKAEAFYNLSINDYEHTKFLLGIKSDFMVYFVDKNETIINLTNSSFITKANYSIQNITGLDPGELVTLNRYIVYRHDDISEIANMRIILWQ